ncbi:MAG: PAS domain S-box protein [Desulfobacterales bacterium]|nr:PAS domain S-box protein [Desulfobacterales bacterium]
MKFIQFDSPQLKWFNLIIILICSMILAVGYLFFQVNALSAVAPVTSSPLFIAADEVNREMYFHMKLFMILSTFAMAVITLVFYQRQQNQKQHLNAVITERLRSEDALRKSDERYQTLIKTTMNGFWVVNIEGHILEVNETYCVMSGYSMEDLLSMNISDLECMESPKEILAHAHNIMVKGRDRFETRHRRSDGTVINVQVSTFFIVSQNLILGFINDITERKQTEEALKSSEIQYRRLFESAKDGILILEADTGIIVDVNPFLLEMLGYSHEQFLGKRLWELGFFKDIVANQNNFNELQKHDYIRYEDLPLETSDGRRIDVEFISNVYLVNHLRVIQCNIRNISDRKREEKEKLKLQAQLNQSQKMESVGRLAGGVAHDFNNMLSVIMGYTEMSFDQMDKTHPLYANLIEIKNAAQRSADLTRQLLSFARKQTITPKIIYLNDIVAGMLNMLRRLIGEDIDMVWIPGANLWSIKIDPSQIDQILANLCVNARDAIENVGKVTIKTENISFDNTYCANHTECLPGDYVCLIVSDNGKGMEKEIQQQIFEPFFTTKEVGQGSGLGLSTIYGIVKQNNGFIDVYSKPGKGTIFRIYFPQYAEKKTETQIKATQEIIPQGHETILVVEDEPALLEMTMMMLEKLGYTVLAASTPDIAMGLAIEHSEKIHMLLTDIIMPQINGLNLSKKLLSLYPEIKCLFMSGYTSNVMAQHGVLDEGMHFIQKPFSMKAIAAKIRNVLGSGNNNALQVNFMGCNPKI